MLSLRPDHHFQNSSVIGGAGVSHRNGGMLCGRTALVTGASSGIGRDIARALASAGANVVAAARRMDRLEDLVSDIEAAGGRALAVPADVEDEASLIAAFDAAQARFGLIDTVYANAGIDVEGLATDLPAEAFDRVMRINTRGVFLTAREAARRLLAAGPDAASRGRIVLVGSIGGLTVIPGSTAYCVSKAGVVMLGRSLAREWARQGLNVNVVCPGFLETELNRDRLALEAGKKMVRAFPRRRLMTTDDLQGLMLFLGSDQSRAVTGGVFTIDDGQSL